MEELLTKEEQKALAVQALKDLECYKPYLRDFEKKGIVTLYEGFGGYYLDPKYGSTETELMDYIKEVENEKGILVYAVIHNHFEFGECYTMLCVSKYKADANKNVVNGSVFAWVWNKDDEFGSEFGYVGVKQVLGGLIRTW